MELKALVRAEEIPDLHCSNEGNTVKTIAGED